MCQCAEMYVCLRSKFITSYSVLSICHWLLGIGDRHLNNTIVSKENGHCIGNYSLITNIFHPNFLQTQVN